MKRVLMDFQECVQKQGLKYDRYDDLIYVKDSPLLKYSKLWIEKNNGLTEEEIRKSMTGVDGWEVTLHELLFKEVVSYKNLTIKLSISDLPSVRAITGSFNLILKDERIPLEIREEYVYRYNKLKEQFEFDKEAINDKV
jgi:hypothetical protein